MPQEPPSGSASRAEEPALLFHKAFSANNANDVRQVLLRFPELKARINDPVAAFDSPIITHVKSRPMLDVLLEAGADINAKSRWWAGGFGLLHSAEPDLADYAIQRGAQVDTHAAARLGLMDRLRELVTADPSRVRERGGDGQMPLHFARTIEVAQFLLDHGADIDARDIDHESTAAQYVLGDRLEIARFLVKRGCKTDLLMAAALGDLELARRHLDADPECIHIRVTPEFFPMIGPRAGGTIYQWTLGWFVSPHDVAHNLGHPDMHRFLMDRSPPELRLIAACWAGDEATAKQVLEQHPGIVSQLSPGYRRHAALAARNNRTEVVRLLLEIGLPSDAVGQHQATPLHWACFHGNSVMVETVLRYNPPLEQEDADFHATPMGWAMHGSEHGWHACEGNYAETVRHLLRAGAKVPSNRTDGTPEVKEVLRTMSR